MLGQLITALRTGRVGKGVIGARALGIGAVCLGLLADCRNLSAVEIPLNGHTFTLPDGFDIELIAGPPLVNRPITADFDEQGRLYVSDSSGSNEKVQVQLEQKPHRILRLEDVDGDGVFDRSQVFADRLMFPEGTMWYDGSLYVAAPPSIWKFTDVDGDGVAEHREEWFQGKTLTGCANDLHGPYFGPDGWIYWCKGAFAEQTYTIGGREWKTRASHIFRCRPDGTGIEPVMTGGMDNPVDTVFLPNGDRVFTTTFLVHPGNGQRDGLIHAVYGGVYGKEQGALDGHPRTGELMPVLSHLGAAAPCGLTRYESTAFGDDFRDNLFAAQFNMHKISRHKLTRRGASYVAEDSDFVVSNNIDFHTTDVLADADGSLIVVDTGGWYKLCCPTSQLHKPDILGALYRIRRTGAPRVEDPRGRGIAWSQLSAEALREKFGDPRPAVRRRAMHEFASRFGSGESLPALAGPWGIQASARASAESEKNLVWALTRVDHPVARELVRQRVSESATDDEVRQVALQSISLWRDTGARDVLVRQLLVGSPYARRVAAEALGRLGDRTVVPQLLAAAQALDSLTLPPRTPAGATAGGTTSSSEPGSAPATTALSGSETDRALEHAITYALIQLGDPSATALGLASDHPWTRRVALVALDQMPGGGLAADQVTPLLSATDPVVRETAHWIVSHHADWGSQLAGYFARRLAAVGKKTTGSVEGAASADPELEQRLVRFAANPTIESMLAQWALDSERLSVPARQLVLRAMAQARPKEMPASWGAALGTIVQAGTASEATVVADDPILAAAIAAARDLTQPKKPYQELNVALRQAAENDQLAPQLRLDAMAAVAGGMPALSEPQFALLLASLLPDKPVATRSAAADAIAKAGLGTVQLDRLTDTIKSIGPLELDRLLAPFERSTDEKLGLKLIAALKQSLSLTSLRLDSLQQKLAKYSPAVQQGVTELVAMVNVEAAQQKQRIDELLPEVAAGDIRRGQAVFNSAKSACTACHRFGYLGGSAGPDLTRIGGIRTERDLLEAILYPSLSFVRSYEPVVVVTTDGRIVNGLIRNETATELVLTTGPNQEVKVTREDIEEIRPSTVSVMPAGLDKQLTEQELADLVTFLKNAK